MGTRSLTCDAVDQLSTSTAGSNVPSQCAGKFNCWTWDAFGNRTMEAISTKCCNLNPTPQVVTTYNSANNQI